MARFAQLLIPGNFAAGVTRYRDHYPGQERFARVVLPVTMEGRLVVQAIVDIGAPWCVIDPAIARRLGAAVRADYVPGERLLIRGTWYEGRLLRMRMGLRAEHGGDDLEVDATVCAYAGPG